MRALGWDTLDIILVSGDAYIDSPFVGVALIGKLLVSKGYRVGVIAQPDTKTGNDITRLGEPRLFWGVSEGCIDSMVANYTALKRPRRRDDYTAGGENTRRPDRASIVYTGLIRRFFKNTAPIVLGGIGASLRRIAHYDYWSNSIRRSILFDTKADILVYGMGESAVLNLAERLANSQNYTDIPGICYISKDAPKNFIALPSFDEVRDDKRKFIEMHNIFYANIDPRFAKGLYQKHDARYLIHTPPQQYLYGEELDKIYSLDFEREAHPSEKSRGEVRAVETIRFSVTRPRGCFGGCNFCAIAVHQGKAIRSRSEKSVLDEIRNLTSLPDFKGIISDIGGPTANMYGMGCDTGCVKRKCLFPSRCKTLKIDHTAQIRLLKRVREIKGVKKAFVASGIRYDLIMDDKKAGIDYLREIIKYHISGQLKVAPEHHSDNVLTLMGKPSVKYLEEFKSLFDKLNRETGKKQFLTYYFITAHPGCGKNDTEAIKRYSADKLRLNPEQVQTFTPTPMTYSTLMYATGTDPFTGKAIRIEHPQKR